MPGLREAVDWFEDRDLRTALLDLGYEVWTTVLGAMHDATGRTDAGVPVYERDWDVLVVLDACRHDIFDAVAREYDFLPNEVPATTSVASYSLAWLSKNFTEAYEHEMALTGHVTANPYSDTALDSDDWASLDEVWRDAWDDDLGTVPPRPVTDRAIRAWRDGDEDRLIVHYMQPHVPFIAGDDDRGLSSPHTGRYGDGTNRTAFDELRTGDRTRHDFWCGYADTLRLVLDEVELLVQNIDADTVAITADHGNAVGEYGIYGHPRGVALPAIRRVPWAETTAEATGDYTPDSGRTPAESGDPFDRLRDLGYR